MTTTLDLPGDLARAVQRRAEQEGRDLAAEVVELVRKGLAVSEPALPQIMAVSPIITKDSKTGLPLIRGGADAPLSRMTTEDLQALIENSQLEEDLERLGIPARP
ncbi:MAG: hypothetical protein JO353_06495 [Phycisphaerae bacterium]|nr:hypothetical protein [Phycisphaerae bacterium]